MNVYNIVSITNYPKQIKIIYSSLQREYKTRYIKKCHYPFIYTYSRKRVVVIYYGIIIWTGAVRTNYLLILRNILIDPAALMSRPVRFVR